MAAAAAMPSQPTRTPQLCFATVVLRDFLRASRAVDDTITQHLNALVAPARAGFDPASTAQRPSSSSSLASPAFSSFSTAAAAGASSSAPPSPACQAFRDTVLFPAWQARDDVIQYCTDVAREAAAAQTASAPVSSTAVAATPLTERFDPYVNRQQYAQVETQAELLAALMRQERGVESIVRAQSWAVLRARCGGGVGDGGWADALAQWQTQAGR